ncbi:hypothetical protein HZB01_01060 [Candidatus Woesearchaeota archaeon]|nr:hypothetical protein [Candidatus Woesearchaeota archaeon]
MEYRKHPERRMRHLLSAPIIWAMIVPLVFFDICMEIYHRICFPLYGLSYVDRLRYIRIDRHRLKYLSFWEKVNCAYCGYANGLMHYASIIAGETERYWCGIRHERISGFVEPEHHKAFLAYGDAKAFLKKFVFK